MKKLLLFFTMLFSASQLLAEDGYELWLRYKPLNNKQQTIYKQTITELQISGNSATINAAKQEKTKIDRMTKIKPMIMEHIGLNDKYRK